MPFAITCPKCAAQFRSSKERPVGKGVECKKCGEQFYVSADNQKEISTDLRVAASKAKADEAPRRRPRDDDDEVDLDEAPRSRKPRTEEDEDEVPRSRKPHDDDDDVELDDAPRSRKPRDEDDEEVDAPRSRKARNDDDDEVDLDDRPRRRSRADDEDDERPRRKRGGRKTVVLVLGLVGLVVLLGGGVGAYFLFFAGGGSAANKVPPPRDVDLGLFAYAPSPKARVEYFDYAMAREKGYKLDVYYPDLAATLPKGAGITADQVAAVGVAKELQSMTAPEVYAVRLAAPQDVAGVAARCQFIPMAGAKAGVFTDKDADSAWVLSQPDPKTLVFVRTTFGQTVDRPKMARLAERPLGTGNLSESLQVGLKSVSGYPIFSGSEHPGGPDYESKADFSGQFVDAQNIWETYSYSVFKSESAAKQWWSQTSKSGGSSEKTVGNLEKKRWIVGDTIHIFMRTQRQ